MIAKKARIFGDLNQRLGIEEFVYSLKCRDLLSVGIRCHYTFRFAFRIFLELGKLNSAAEDRQKQTKYYDRQD
jgi:hypothetical protein